MMHAEQKVDVFEFVSRIRNQRPQMVQTDMQYTFIYQALLEYYLYGDTELDVASLEKHLQSLHSPTAPLDKIGLEEEFRVGANIGSGASQQRLWAGEEASRWTHVGIKKRMSNMSPG
ncbi:receptor-type tyrosine-protein phosphatase epsilon-like [Vombatus ursinus]|uniref:receptor-type tyrosine-protein phosphatase epsilon-like n=1 Tax=Vombatus ursinus TaxID=29139 RepID=UPI000FFD5901|nr:receptor-type tyrosine-protein phosphatase epsilon-like [Vombatus ursinus]